MLKQFSMKNFKNDYLPIGSGITLSKKDCEATPKERERMSRVSYASAVGSIVHTLKCTRLKLVYSLEVVSGYQSNLSRRHWKMVKTIVWYLRNTENQCLIHGEPDLKPARYTDPSF